MGPLTYLLNLLVPPEPEPVVVVVPDRLCPDFPDSCSLLVGEALVDLCPDWAQVCRDGIEDGWLATARWCPETCTLTVGRDPVSMSLRMPLGATPRQAAYAAVAAMSAATMAADADWEMDYGNDDEDSTDHGAA